MPSTQQPIGRMLVLHKGAYSGSTQYEFLDEVSYQGSTYRYINQTASSGHAPTDTNYWVLVAQKGVDGEVTEAELAAALAPIEEKIPSGASTSNKLATASDVNARVTWTANGVLGAKNRYNNANTNGKPGSVLTKTDTGFRCVVSTNSTWNGATNELRCSANVGFTLSLDTAITSGITYTTVAGSTDGSIYTTITNSSILTTSGSVNLEFNTGNYTYLRITFFTTNNDIKTCDVTISNIMLYDSADTDSTYQPYAMTNRELTDLGLVYHGVIPAGASLDDYVECGIWDIKGTNPTGLPTGSSGYVPLIVLPRWGRGNIKQIIMSRGNEIYLRNQNDGESWSSWYKFTGTAVS